MPLRALLKQVIRKPRWTRPTIKVFPVSTRASLTGTAFDYLLRFELQRRFRGTPIEHGWWIAKMAAPQVPKKRLSKQFIKEAEQQVDFYSRGYFDTVEMAKTCTVLAKFDFVYRAGWADPQWLVTDEVVAEELLELLEVVPFEAFQPKHRLTLNPTFGEGSHWVGGADSDVMVDGLLIDLKTVTKAELSLDELRQLVGYGVLARLGGIHIVDSPASQQKVNVELESLGLYYARHGHLITFDLDDLVIEDGWELLEDYFLTHYASTGKNVSDIAAGD
ncbi:hypothetical protein DVJ83_15175 (plasmid) [Deinococcus wulumuqiensis]|uniref:PD-(D/E)XK endonuclease-like domain-containing protein n=2 Tax=Deinococcus wulumuqiensis TaxID=980427 RepID=A0A345ILE7_9DEIO|nr:hypothetical protein DVJ83_15175 [Deinococcus wulumuqiensis]